MSASALRRFLRPFYREERTANVSSHDQWSTWIAGEARWPPCFPSLKSRKRRKRTSTHFALAHRRSNQGCGEVMVMCSAPLGRTFYHTTAGAWVDQKIKRRIYMVSRLARWMLSAAGETISHTHMDPPVAGVVSGCGGDVAKACSIDLRAWPPFAPTSRKMFQEIPHHTHTRCRRVLGVRPCYSSRYVFVESVFTFGTFLVPGPVVCRRGCF